MVVIHPQLRKARKRWRICGIPDPQQTKKCMKPRKFAISHISSRPVDCNKVEHFPFHYHIVWCAISSA